MDIIRALLLRVEEFEIPGGGYAIVPYDDELLKVDDHSLDEGIYNFGLLISAGYVQSAGKQGLSDFVISGLSWSGHDLLETVRNQEVWSRTKIAAKKVGGVGLDLFVQIAKAEAKRFAAEKLGIPL